MLSIISSKSNSSQKMHSFTDPQETYLCGSFFVCFVGCFFLYNFFPWAGVPCCLCWPLLKPQCFITNYCVRDVLTIPMEAYPNLAVGGPWNTSYNARLSEKGWQGAPSPCAHRSWPAGPQVSATTAPSTKPEGRSKLGRKHRGQERTTKRVRKNKWWQEQVVC